ncbi:Cell division protein FtsB [Dokdonia pacifica]|uniref:Cell division protein FtsB n=2 Tax=Dokdonia pacifica TaxID=1627892 RepID=A0A238ZCA3_9FLAO|nr:Cell division protein FtsB [Dokdonia pacifica]
MSAYRKGFSIFVIMGLKHYFEKIKKKNALLGGILLVAISPYVLILLIFIIWMLFFDGNSWLIHNELNGDIKKLKGNQEHFETKIREDQEQIKKLEDSAGLERFAREEYLMKKPDEEIYIIEYEDSIPKNDKE